MFGQRASSQIVCRLAPWISFRTSKYFPFDDGARTFIHSGRRGRPATGSDPCISRSLEIERRLPTEVDELRVAAAEGDQLVVPAPLDDRAAVDHDDLVGVVDGRE